MSYIYTVLVNSDNSKLTNKIKAIFQNVRSISIVASFLKHLEPQNKNFTHGIWVTTDKLKSISKNQDTLYI